MNCFWEASHGTSRQAGGLGVAGQIRRCIRREDAADAAIAAVKTTVMGDTDASISASPVLVTTGSQVGGRQKNVVSVTCAF